MQYVSPLRYPGGKGKMTDFLARLIRDQRPRPTTYIEPFAGGAGAAVALLHLEVVDRIILNDLNRGIAQFWQSVFSQTEELIHRIQTCDVSTNEWHRQREVYLSDSADGLDLAFAVFYLNRTNRSGILDARPIGGLEQTGNWKIDARFNKKDLIERIENLGAYRHRVEITSEDGIDLMASFRDKKGASFFYIDPPYFGQGDELYMNTLTWADHSRLAKTIAGDKLRYWLLTYDADPRVETLYPKHRIASFSISHTAAKQHVGMEYMVVSDLLNVVSLDGISRRNGSWLERESSVDDQPISV
ncbi:DNA adenine methylase [Nonomuraea fuscirosea]|uniref:DNA adenine methylase n=1 Tax=Nonomuraea fuscirosea TaxID=1291556 RepID=UPI0033E754C2